jgi:DNA-binding MarR family transcriptional regulator
MELTPVQGHALRSLDPEQPVAMSSLADALFCDASNVTGIVDKLESRGLIARQGADHDRRVKQLVVTEKGRKVRDRLIAKMLEAPAAVAAVPPETKSRLCNVLRAILKERGG